MARTYKRDSRGRFASGGSARSTPKTRVVTGARAVSGGKNRLTRDNAGRITSVGGQGATARGGRLRTASGAKRGAVIVRMNSTGGKLRKPIGGGARISRAEPLATGGTLAARSSLARARRKLAENATPAQRGAVTRAKKYAAQSYDRNTQPKTFGRPASVMRKRPPEAPLRWQVGGGKGENMRDKDTRQQKINQESVKSLLAAGRAVAVYPKKGIVVIDGFQRQKVSKAMAAALGKIVKEHLPSRPR